MITEELTEEDVELLVDVYNKHGENIEWYTSQLSIAILHTKTIKDAIRLANYTNKMYPDPPETNDEEEYELQEELGNQLRSIFKDQNEESEDTDEDTNTDATFGMVGDEWHGPTPPSKGWKQIQPGPRGGKRWKKTGGSHDRGTGSEDGSSHTPTKGGMAKKTGRPSTEKTDRVRPDTHKPTDTKTTGDTRPTPSQPSKRSKPVATTTKPIEATSTQRATDAISIGQFNQKIDGYLGYFRGKRQPEIVEWFDELKDHINKVGAAEAARMLGESRADTLTSQPDTETRQYKGTGYWEGEYEKDGKFLKDYLNRTGIILQTGDIRDPNVKVVASAPIKSAIKQQKKGDIIARETNINTKLEESKMLPGLESSEDIHKIVGREVTHFTPDVMRKLDEVYGKGKWIVKSYGDEAYAGFGVFFPQRIKEIQRSSKESLWETNRALKKFGYQLARSRESGEVTGIKDSRTGNVYEFNSQQYNSIKNNTVKKLGNIAAASASSEKGAKLPTSEEESLKQDYGIRIVRSEQDDKKVVGITDEDGRYIAVNSKEWKHYGEFDAFGLVLERAITSVESGQAGDSRFMVQPAFQAVGVTEEDRALGATWETSTEGRVHVVSRDGKASVIPFATMANRGDAFPVVFASDDIRAMEKAVQDAIDALPASERAGQSYAPDVMKTKDGWRVVELNASSESGQSLWLEENPFVIDAYVSHLTGREPAHARFIRSLLQGNALERRKQDQQKQGTKQSKEQKLRFRKKGG